MKLVLENDIALANSKVSMSRACELIGMRDVDYASSGAKVDCPFGAVFHPGGGKSFRIYENEHAYCYACGERYTPVSLYALAKDISPEDAAEHLLEAVGYKKPSADDRYEEALNYSPRVDQGALAEALKKWCLRNYPEWEDRQFDDDVALMFRRCTDLLPNVRSAEGVALWKDAAHKAMTRVLGATS